MLAILIFSSSYLKLMDHVDLNAEFIVVCGDGEYTIYLPLLGGTCLLVQLLSLLGQMMGSMLQRKVLQKPKFSTKLSRFVL